MNKQVIIGVDGGATKSHLAVFDETGKCAGTTVYGPLNHEGMDGSYDELERRLGELIPRTLKSAGARPADVAFGVFGLAGVDSAAQGTLISGMIRKTGIVNSIVCNDAILGVPAGCPDGIGICAINGTGFKIAAIDRNGIIADTCGLGGYTDDRGGGTWYVERICGEVYNALYKLGRPTKMREMVFDVLGISEKSTFLDAITENIYGDPELQRNVDLNNIVFRAASAGDEVALDILRESAEQYSGAIARMAMDMYFPCDEVLHVTLAGSVFVREKVRILHDMIEKKVAEILGEREVVYHVLDTPPVTGAVMLAARNAGYEISGDLVKAALKVAGL